jgi:hypothetical protein
VFWLFIGVCALGYVVCGVNHYFKLEELQDSSQESDKKSNKKSRIPLEKLQTEKQRNKQLGEFATAIDNRLLKEQPENDRTLVVVAASGGGIQASGWTAQVLGGLQEELGCSFTKAIGLISSVSGGSVGTMYFLDGFEEKKQIRKENNNRSNILVKLLKIFNEQKNNSPNKNNLKFKNQTLNEIFDNATEDWLDAVGWGIAYPDLVRLTGWLSPLIGKYNDRGFALEDDWKIKMNKPAATLEDWREKIIKGEIPIPVFNTTLVEDGRRFLISPMKFIEGDLADLINSDENRKVLDFQTLYEGYDLNLTTAARLSATFPYVSPLPCNDRGISIDLPEGKKFYGNYHFADGGYFDNSGLFTAVEWINLGLNSFLKDLGIKRILLLQINAFPESESKSREGSKGDKKWFMQSLGPLQTVFAVRNSTLISRNFKEAELLAKKWQNQVDIKHFMISFPEGFNQPLSWRLTEKQKNNLKLAWQKITETPNFQNLKNLWKENWEMPYCNNKQKID